MYTYIRIKQIIIVYQTVSIYMNNSKIVVIRVRVYVNKMRCYVFHIC